MDKTDTVGTTVRYHGTLNALRVVRYRRFQSFRARLNGRSGANCITTNTVYTGQRKGRASSCPASPSATSTPSRGRCGATKAAGPKHSMVPWRLRATTRTHASSGVRRGLPDPPLPHHSECGSIPSSKKTERRLGCHYDGIVGRIAVQHRHIPAAPDPPRRRGLRRRRPARAAWEAEAAPGALVVSSSWRTQSRNHAADVDTKLGKARPPLAGLVYLPANQNRFQLLKVTRALGHWLFPRQVTTCAVGRARRLANARGVAPEARRRSARRARASPRRRRAARPTRGTSSRRRRSTTETRGRVAEVRAAPATVLARPAWTRHATEGWHSGCDAGA